MFYNLNCFLLFSMIYHFQINNLLKCINQTIEIIIWFLITSYLNKNWNLFFLLLQAQLNSVKHAVTEAALNKLVYSVNLKSVFNAFNELYEETVLNLIIIKMWEMLQQKAADITLFINVKAKICYNFNHQFIEVKKNN